MARYLCPGRWQPFHAGHEALIDKLLSEGHEVIVGIRDTPFGPNDPYSAHERYRMIRAVYGDRVQTWVMPDFDMIAYGRNVGWGLREIALGEQTTAISGTATRAAGGRIIWLTGNSGAGKTSLANELCRRMRAIKLDGNEMRDSISVGAGFSEEERLKHNLRVARLAMQMSKQMDVIVSVIAPTPRCRQGIATIITPIWVFVKRTLPEREGYFYTPPESPDIIVDHDVLSLEQAAELVMRRLAHWRSRA